MDLSSWNVRVKSTSLHDPSAIIAILVGLYVVDTETRKDFKNLLSTIALCDPLDGI